MTSVAIYSALYGSYEPAKPLPVGLSCPAYMFTDDPKLDAPGWIIRYEPKPVTKADIDTPMMQAKWWKTQPRAALGHAYDVTLWVDASITLKSADYPQRCLEALGDDDWAMVKHPGRDCIYAEADYSAALLRYKGADLKAQAKYYRNIGHPERWGLVATGANARRNNDICQQVSAQWWWENATRTWQDQVSLPVLARLAQLERGFRFNTNIPWGTWWGVQSH